MVSQVDGLPLKSSEHMVNPLILLLLWDHLSDRNVAMQQLEGQRLVTGRIQLKRVFCIGLLSVQLAACASGTIAEPGLAVSTSDSALGQAEFTGEAATAAILRPADVISVSVFREEALSLDSVPISASGEVSFPLIGTMNVAGMSTAELELHLEEALQARYLRNPHVTVNVLEYGSHEVTVEGQVTNPGVYRFQPGTRLSGGISLAAGPTRVADSRDIVVFRQTDAGMQIAKFDYSAVRAGTMLDPILQPGDRIIIGTDGLSQFWQDALRAVPAVGLFTNVGI